MSEQSLSNTCIFSVKHITVCLCLGILDRTSVLCLGAILNSEIINKSTKMWHLNRLEKGQIFIAWLLKREGRASPHFTLAGNVHVR